MVRLRNWGKLATVRLHKAAKHREMSSERNEKMRKWEKWEWEIIQMRAQRKLKSGCINWIARLYVVYSCSLHIYVVPVSYHLQPLAATWLQIRLRGWNSNLPIAIELQTAQFAIFSALLFSPGPVALFPSTYLHICPNSNSPVCLCQKNFSSPEKNPGTFATVKLGQNVCFCFQS